MHYIYDKKTDTYSRMLAKPFMQKNSQFVELTEEDFYKRLKEQAAGRNAEKELFEDSGEDLTSGVEEEADGEDGQ